LYVFSCFLSGRRCDMRWGLQLRGYRQSNETLNRLTPSKRHVVQQAGNRTKDVHSTATTIALPN
jgi:hypothetical protein